MFLDKETLLKIWLKGEVTRDDCNDAQHSVAALLQHCFEWSQHCSSIATLRCSKNSRRESSCVLSL